MENSGWDIRALAVQGRSKQLIRWMAKMYEDVTTRVRELQAQGKNVTRFSMLNTLENFNLVESGCLQCLNVFIAFTNNYEENYPETMEDMVLVNSESNYNLRIFFIVNLRINKLLNYNDFSTFNILCCDEDSQTTPFEIYAKVAGTIRYQQKSVAETSF